jgi:TatD DNase family protein
MEEFAPDLDEVLSRAAGAEVESILVVGSDEVGSAAALELVKTRGKGGLFAAVGIHPHESSSAFSGIPNALKKMARSPEVVAIGETGLDFFYEHSPRDVQERVFAEHVALAKRVKKPLVVHVRDAYPEALEILKSEGAHECGGVIHCFSGSLEDAFTAIELGFFISFAGPLTYPKNAGLRDVAAALPLERLLCETDAPFLSPQPRRGRRNEPSNVAYVYQALAEAREIPLEECAGALWENASRLFRWNRV